MARRKPAPQASLFDPPAVDKTQREVPWWETTCVACHKGDHATCRKGRLRFCHCNRRKHK